jgi:hypothetical protein
MTLDQMNQIPIPAWLFYRERHIELEGGFILAGRLTVDLPAKTKLKARNADRVAAIIEQLLTYQPPNNVLPDHAVIYGWHHGTRPSNADNDEIMIAWENSAVAVAWAKRSMKILVRVDPRDLDRYLKRERGTATKPIHQPIQ